MDLYVTYQKTGLAGRRQGDRGNPGDFGTFAFRQDPAVSLCLSLAAVFLPLGLRFQDL